MWDNVSEQGDDGSEKGDDDHLKKKTGRRNYLTGIVVRDRSEIHLINSNIIVLFAAENTLQNTLIENRTSFHQLNCCIIR